MIKFLLFYNKRHSKCSHTSCIPSQKTRVSTIGSLELIVKDNTLDGHRSDGLVSFERSSVFGIVVNVNAVFNVVRVFIGCNPKDAGPSFKGLKTIGPLTIVCIVL